MLDLNEFKQQLNAYYAGTGYNKCDTLKYLKDLKIWQGFDQSYDGSLVVFHHKQFIIIAGSCSDYTIIEK